MFKNADQALGVPAFLDISKIKKIFYFLKDHLKFQMAFQNIEMKYFQKMHEICNTDYYYANLI